VTSIVVRPVADEDAAVWRLTQEVAGMFADLPWVLIGGMMVRVLEIEHGVQTPWLTGDVDTVLDTRMVSTATEEAATRLGAAAFLPQRYDENLTYRLIRDRDIVDVLAPDHLGRRAKRTTVAPDETLEALGARQALNRRRTVTIDAGNGPFELPCPSLTGALVIKARVADRVQGRRSQDKHERDLARLLALVPDPLATRNSLSRRERGYFRARENMTDVNHVAWTDVPSAENGAIALSILGEVDPSRPR
jgi:hypothetical protein